jgi:hypothetical protein
MLDGALHRLGPVVSDAIGSDGASRFTASRPRPRFSPKARASLVLQGRYIGYIRHLKPRQKAQVRKIRETKGVRAAIAKARGLSQSNNR